MIGWSEEYKRGAGKARGGETGEIGRHRKGGWRCPPPLSMLAPFSVVRSVRVPLHAFDSVMQSPARRKLGSVSFSPTDTGRIGASDHVRVKVPVVVDVQNTCPQSRFCLGRMTARCSVRG